MRRVRLDTLADIDTESLPETTRPSFAFRYIDISAAAEGRLQIPTGEIAFGDAPSRARRIVRDGDVLMSTVRPSLKAFAYCTASEGPLVASTGFAVLRARENVEPYFLLCSILADDATRQMEKLAVGSNYPALNASDVRRLLLPSMSPTHQKRIATIAKSVDAAIERTEELIAKYRQIKAGLMQDLFSRGVASSGCLRAPQSEAPEQYKRTEVGWIPSEWTVRRVHECGDVKLGRQRSPDQHSGRWPMPYLRVANVFDGWIDFDDVLEMDFTPKERREFALEPGDILLNEGQSLELVGRSALFEGRAGEYCFQNTLVRFRCLDGNVPRFFGGLFKLWLDGGKFQTIAKQTTSVAHLGADRFARMVCAVPTVAEQEQISHYLQRADARITSLNAELRKLRDVKSGLMQDLLSGKVPVSVAETAAEPAHA